MKQIVALGDQAALAYFEDETSALRFSGLVRRAPPRWLLDVVPAYSSVAVFFDLEHTRFAEVADELGRLESSTAIDTAASGKLHRIPCCYEFQLDMERVARLSGLTAEKVIELHTGREFTVYAIGFCPGFPYLGYLPDALAGVPRLETPRVRVPPGSIGLTGRQTGIYTQERPGGWNLIGRTPLELVDVADGYFPLRTGDQVRFEAIDAVEFGRLQGSRL